MADWVWLMAFVTLQRGVELLWARRNEARLRRLGAEEAGAAHYPLIVGLHLAWLAWLWFAARDRPVSVAFVGVFALLQAGRVWVLATLGSRWTTRVLIIPGETLVRRGPYRFFSHPNYLVVALEIPTLPLCFGLWGSALVFGLANLAVLALRLRVEERALSGLRTAGAAVSG